MDVTNLYNAQFIDHVNHPDYNYELEDATCEHDGINPSCGDELHIAVRLDGQGRIEEASYTGHGCAVSMASADIMSDLMIGKTKEEAIALCDLFGGMLTGAEQDKSKLASQLDEAMLLSDIRHMPARVKCAELSWRTLAEMLRASGLE